MINPEETLYLPVIIKDVEGKMKPNKKVKAEVQIVTEGNKLSIFVPPTRKKVPTNSTEIFKSEKVALCFKSCLDGRINASGRLSDKMIKRVGRDVLIQEFIKAAESLWAYAK